MKRLMLRVAKDREGASAVEFALAAPVFLILVMSLAQVGILFLAKSGVQHAVGEAARYATVYPAPSDQEIVDFVQGSKFGLQASQVQSVSVARGESNGIDYAEVTMIYNVPVDFAFLTKSGVTIEERRRAYIP